MIILIDGYNLIKHITGNKNTSEAERGRFIRQIESYFKHREHEVWLIFDGGSTAYPDTSTHGVLKTVFSGYKKTADEYILYFIEGHKEHEILVVTDDRELKDFVKKAGKHVLGTYEFYHDFVLNKPKIHETRAQHELIKFSHENSPELDALMTQASELVFNKDGEPQSRTAEPVRGTKKERARERVLEKLRK